MSIDRRSFFKVLGLTGISLAAGTKLNASAVVESGDVEFKAILIDTTRCEGCQSCEFACAESNGLPEPQDSPATGTIRKLDENRRSVINGYETSKGEVYVKQQCMHCNEPACAAACLTNAMTKHVDGPVTWEGRKCMGCRYCMVSCPFDIPKFEYHSPNPKIVKCDMCFDRLQEGQKPACVENCPADGILFGTRRELIKEARQRIYDNPDLYVDHIYGEHEAGGTGILYLSKVPFNELGFNTKIQKTTYPELSKGFLYSVPTIFVLWPAILLGIREATKNNNNKEEENA